jgi:hypothetical protein
MVHSDCVIVQVSDTPPPLQDPLTYQTPAMFTHAAPLVPEEVEPPEEVDPCVPLVLVLLPLLPVVPPGGGLPVPTTVDVQEAIVMSTVATTTIADPSFIVTPAYHGRWVHQTPPPIASITWGL